MVKTLRDAANWAFRSRQTGRITLVHPPNALALTTSGALAASTLLARRSPGAARAAAVLGRVTGLVWAADEVVRGVNPFRRAVGAVALVRLLRWTSS
ncbi:hypothetical protein HJG43_06080 [Kineosporiaceae bacterium SCSIO 59966]|nr:hypothetical protein HJG43_06080 [Kineosporiaceae bacterium SCSIO 59966]